MNDALTGRAWFHLATWPTTLDIQPMVVEGLEEYALRFADLPVHMTRARLAPGGGMELELAPEDAVALRMLGLDLTDATTA